MVWFTSPAKEVLNVLFNRILAPYVENLDMSQVNYGIGQGQLTLQSLRLKKGALDKFRLPVDVIEGHLGKFTLSLHWMNLGNQPVEIFVEDVYLLVVPSPLNNDDPEEEEAREQAVKQDRVKNAELLHLSGSAEKAQEDPQESQGLIASLIAKILNNLQITVKNVHIRYEDKISVPGHPFAAGLTLSGFTARSVNNEWKPAFIESTAGAIHKLGKLESFAIYFNTNAETMEGLPHSDFVKKFADQIARDGHIPDHQFIMKPVTGEGRIKMNNRLDKNTPRFDVQLLFDEIGVVVDDNQYRNVISLLDMFHFYARQHQYRKYRPTPEEFEQNKSRALLLFAGTAILGDIRERNRRWTWGYLAERRDDRKQYVDLFKKQSLNQLTAGSSEAQLFEALERKLSYEDIRFYRSIARSQLRKDLAVRRKIEYERARQQQEQPQQQSRGWGSWLWGSSSTESSSSGDGTPDELSALGAPMTDSQRKELYDMLDYDETAALTESLSTSDALKARVVAKLQKGSFALKADPHGKAREIMSIQTEHFQADVLQRQENLECAISLGGIGVFDGTVEDSLYSKIVHVKDIAAPDAGNDPFFYLKFENKPLDQRADMGITMKLRHMEIIYHRGYVEAIYRFFKPPESQLESVEALLSAASETLEGIRRDTRAGLEYALQTHKTVDIQMDLNAPIIIVPEKITTNKCRHLIIDAGHISIESDLADKGAIREIQSKRNKQYTEADYKRLESLMYDKFSLKLEAAQFLLGDDLDSCRRALTSTERDTLHLLERINMDFQVQNSIVPAAHSLARVKVAGNLPSLQLNFSDAKYKTLMRLIDVTIPNFDGNADGGSAQSPSTRGPKLINIPRPELPGRHVSGGFALPYWNQKQEYVVDSDDEDEVDEDEDDEQEQFFDPETPSTSARPELHQHTFELTFSVSQLRVLISKSDNFSHEKELGNITFGYFALDFALARFHMQADVRLREMAMFVHQNGKEPIQFMSSAKSGQDRDLLTVKYLRAQKESPEFETLFEGVDQSVDVEISTFVFHAAPEPVLSVYDFIMTTFTTPDATSNSTVPGGVIAFNQNLPPVVVDSKIRVLVKLASVQLVLFNDNVQLATLSLSTAAVTILLRANTLRVTGRLGSMSMYDDSGMEVASPEFKQIMSIEGDNFADFSYQTFDPKDPDNTAGINSLVVFKVASMKLHFIEQALRAVYLFLMKLSNLKFLYDAAAQAAAQRAAEITRMQFEISVKTPILIVPTDATSSVDVLVTQLGEINARNEFEGDVTKTHASLRGIQLVSTLAQQTTLKMVDDIDIGTEIIQTANIDRTRERNRPDTQISVNVSDIRLHLTQTQYKVLMSLMQSIPRVFAPTTEAIADAVDRSSVIPSSQKHAVVSSPLSETEEVLDLRPELPRTTSRPSVWTNIDLVLTVNAVKLHLYGAEATSDMNRRDYGIARFALNGTSLRFKMLSNSAQEAQVVLKSFTMSNTKPGPTKFREIIPAAKHDRNQFMVLYTSSGGTDNSALAVVTIDSPEIIFSLDPIFALANFFTSESLATTPPPEQEGLQSLNSSDQKTGVLDFRVDLHDVSVNLLEDDTRADTRAMSLSIKQILLSQQGILALSIQECGMSLLQMGKSSESARFLDDVDLTFSLDSRAASSTQQVMSIDITAKPIILRASYRDINLILAIVNRALVLSGNKQEPTSNDSNARSGTGTTRPADSRAVVKSGHGTNLATGQARVIMAKEQLSASFEGFRLVLISDIHEQPALHLRVKPFIVNAKDWSGELHASSTLAVALNYWNLTNSHWEPMFDPWTFTMIVSKESATSGPTATLSARERLDLNISTTFVELTLNLLSTFSAQGEALLTRDRGSVAPYHIRNHTGYPINIWSDPDGSTDIKDHEVVKIEDASSMDWRFDDWKTTREHMVTSQKNSIGIHFVGKPWERLRSIPVDREGEFVFSLRPRTERYVDRILCEVKVQDSVKVVTLRSTYKVANLTLYPVELIMVDEAGRSVQSAHKIAPGKNYSLPIEAVARNRIRIQPDQGFGYKWSSAIRFEDLIAKKAFTIKCAHTDEKEAAFRFHACVEADLNDPAAKKYPKVALKLRAPIELENLLPHNLEYRIYDKHTDQNWRSYLRKGGIMPVHSVELGHLVLLNIAIQESAFKPSEFSIINADAHSDFDVEKKLTLRDQRDRKLDVKLNYVRYPDAGGAFKVQIYSPYVLVNKTGLPVTIRSRSSRAAQPTDVAGDTRLEVLSTNTPFLLSSQNDRGHEFTFKLGDSGWSKMIGFEAPSAEIGLVLPLQSQKNEEIQVGLSWAEGLGKYKLSKVITLAPRFLVKNNLKESLCFREHGSAPRGRSTLDPGEREPLQFMRNTQEKLLTLAFPGLNAEWSAPINMEDIGSVHVRLRHPTRPDDVRLLRADIQIDGPSIFIYIYDAQGEWPFVIENLSKYEVSISQTDPRQASDGNSSTPNRTYSLSPSTSMDYSWDQPAARSKSIQLTINGARRAVDIMEIGDLVPFKFATNDGHRVVALDVRADGPRQILRITDYVAENSPYKPKRRNTGSISRADTLRADSFSSSQEAFEAISEDVTATFTVKLDLHGIGISLVNRKLVEVIYISVNDLKFDYTTSPVAQSVNLAAGNLQIDNQLHDAIFPVVLQPTPIGKEAGGVAALPTVQASVVWLADQAHGVFFIKYCSILLQALTIEADEDFLFAVYDLAQIQGAYWETAQEDVLISQPDTIPEPQVARSGQDLYFEVLELQPIRLSISFMRTERVSGETKLSSRNPLAVVVNVLTMTLGNINDAPLGMNALAIKDMRLTSAELMNRIFYHYRQEVLRQVYRILGSADFFGNPVGLFTNVSSGVADIFYEPFNGVVMHGNRDLGIGIAKGAASFVKKTVFGVTDSMTKFTSSVGKGLSVATMDSEFQLRRRMNQRRNKPRHAIYGVAAGAEAFATSVASGMEGILMKPIEGAESGGAAGFFKGVGKGFVGAFTKPAVGIFDLAANVTEGIRNTTTVFDNPARDRVRLPRQVPSDGVLRPYSDRKALGQYWLRDIENGQFRNELYVAHINVQVGDEVIILTTSLLLSIQSKRLQLNWQLPFTSVQTVTVEDTGIRFAHKAGKGHDRFIYIPDKSSQTWFFDEVSAVVKDFNVRKRMD